MNTEMRHALEEALLHMGQTMKAMVKMYCPSASHVSITMVDDNIDIHASELDRTADDYGNAAILDAVLFPDGKIMHVDGDKVTFKEVRDARTCTA